MTEERFRTAGPICPFCGQHVGGDVRPHCTPISCPLWTIEGAWDPAARAFVPIIRGPDEVPT